MSDRVFVDTNIIVYSRDAQDPAKQRKAAAILQELWKSRSGAISTQVLNEYYVTVTQKLNPGLSREEAFADIEALFAWGPCPIDTDVLRKARECQVAYELSWWDSLIVSAAFNCGCTTILSEDLSCGQAYFGIEVRNPFE